MSTTAIEQYTGEGGPPFCEMTLRATGSDKSDLIIPVTLIGVRQSNNTFNIERALEAPDGTDRYTTRYTTRYTPEPVYFKGWLLQICVTIFKSIITC